MRGLSRRKLAGVKRTPGRGPHPGRRTRPPQPARSPFLLLSSEGAQQIEQKETAIQAR